MLDVVRLDFVEAREACSEGDVTTVKRWLAKGGNPNRRDSLGMTMLVWASEYDNTTIAAMLLEAGAKPQCENKAGQSALSLAEEAGNAKLVELMLAKVALDKKTRVSNGSDTSTQNGDDVGSDLSSEGFNSSSGRSSSNNNSSESESEDSNSESSHCLERLPIPASAWTRPTRRVAL